jgi:arylsulfatase A-like enzyme
MDRLAAEGTRFSRAYAAAPWTTPSVMTLFTGLLPSSHHMDGNDRTLHPSVRTLAERLAAAGYATAAVMPALTLADHFGFDRGFDRFDFEAQGHARVSGPWSVNHALEFIRGAAGRPWFAYVHLWDVHYNYNPPVPYSIRFQAGRPPGAGESDDVTARVVAEAPPEPLAADRLAWLEGQYAGELLFTDEQVGRLLAALDELGAAGDTIVLVTADHGEAFQEHGVLGHTVHLYEEMVHVPLLVRWPGQVPAGRQLADVVSLVDVAPTLLELAGVDAAAADFDGRSRAPWLRGGEAAAAPPPAAPLLLATSRRASWRGLRAADAAYLVDLATGREELYDLRADPGQRHDLAGERTEEVAAWRQRLCAALALTPAGGEIPITPLAGDIRAALESGLRGLGYVGPVGSVEAGGGRTQDPAAERRLQLAAIGCGEVKP